MKCRSDDNGWKYRDTDEFMHESYPSLKCSEVLTSWRGSIVGDCECCVVTQTVHYRRGRWYTQLPLAGVMVRVDEVPLDPQTFVTGSDMRYLSRGISTVAIIMVSYRPARRLGVSSLWMRPS